MQRPRGNHTMHCSKLPYQPRQTHNSYFPPQGSLILCAKHACGYRWGLLSIYSPGSWEFYSNGRNVTAPSKTRWGSLDDLDPLTKSRPAKQTIYRFIYLFLCMKQISLDATLTKIELPDGNLTHFYNSFSKCNSLNASIAKKTCLHTCFHPVVVVTVY